MGQASDVSPDTVWSYRFNQFIRRWTQHWDDKLKLMHVMAT